MRIIIPTILMALAGHVFAYPATSSLTPRRQFCSNAPTTIAGTTFDRRTDDTDILTPRSSAHNIYWCVRDSQIYITLAITSILSQAELWPLLRLSMRSANRRTTGYDGLLPGGIFRVESGQMILSIHNADNHQMTWRTLASALWAVTDYMVKENNFGTMVFDIFDGANQVGQGSISF